MAEKPLKIESIPDTMLFRVLASPSTRQPEKSLFSFSHKAYPPFYIRTEKLLCQTVLDQIYTHQGRYALFLHGNAVKAVGRHHGTPSVGNDNKLCIFCKLMEIPGKPVHIGIIQSRLDLI